MRYPLDTRIKTLPEVPYTISYVIRKRQQLDGIYEMPKEKRPSDELIWDGSPEELEKWFDRLLKGKEKTTADLVFSEFEIEA